MYINHDIDYVHQLLLLWDTFQVVHWVGVAKGIMLSQSVCPWWNLCGRFCTYMEYIVYWQHNPRLHCEQRDLFCPKRWSCSLHSHLKKTSYTLFTIILWWVARPQPGRPKSCPLLRFWVVRGRTNVGTNNEKCVFTKSISRFLDFCVSWIHWLDEIQSNEQWTTLYI